ncbi:MAG: chromosome segregation protein SMC, partial [Deltaproteobacteria bacterium]|nr:chromosome segregation protein SMC [Deltaproteobacteria bacterium]
MKLKRLEITGFKSFVERTMLDFDDGITSIVGPNGCGKSNVVDAIRWVMGEQSARNLRGKSMEDVIFGGSENRKPLGMAEVSLVMDNDDGLAPAAFQEYAEIQVTRRLYRNGDSEYLLNKTPCRLLDITELFMDTGVGTRAYSVIEQGKIGMIVNAKPEDRRTLIEEAAGVTKFKARKKSALRKIEATRQNLLRLTDIISEVRRQMNSLKRQAQRAQKFREFREESKKIELQFGLRQYDQLIAKVQSSTNAAEEQTKLVDMMSQQLEQAELELEKARLQHTEREKEATACQEQVYALTTDIQTIESRLEFGVREMENIEQQKDRFVAESHEIEERLLHADGEEDKLEQLKVEQKQANASEEQKLVESEELLATLVQQEVELNDQVEQARNKLYHLLSDLSRMSSQQEEAERRLTTLSSLTERNRLEAVTVKDQYERLQTDMLALASNLTSIETAREDLAKKRLGLNSRLAELRDEFENAEVDLLAKREELNRQVSRLESLQQLERDLEGYDRGVKALLKEPVHKERMLGLVADFLNVPAQYEAVVEAVLGDRLKALVPQSVQSATSALSFLNDNQGRCTFLLPDFPADTPPVFQGGDPLLDKLRVAKETQQLISRLLSGVYLVSTLEPWLNKGLPTGVTLVTEHGEILNDRGEITGGGRQALDQGVLHKKREMKNLINQVSELEKNVKELHNHRESLRQEIAAAETQMREAEAGLHRQEIQVVDR